MAARLTTTRGQKTPYDKALDTLKKVLAERYDQENSIKREGNVMVIPEGWSIATAIQTLEDYRKRQEDTTDKTITITGHVDDTLVALKWVTENLFGNIVGSTIASFFSYTPGQRSATIGYGQTVTVPFGDIRVPGLEIAIQVESYERDRNPMKHLVGANFHYVRKYQPLVDQIEEMWLARLRDHSIFKGQAIDSTFQFLNLSSATDATSKLVYTRDEELALSAQIFTPIMDPERLRRAGIPQRRTVVLTGSYGTGKSLTALLVAERAVENGWTFMTVRPGDGIVEAMEFARKFQPAVLFFEDIDAEAGGQLRDTRMNQILNTMDSMLGKTTPVVTVMTTNHLEKLNRAMLRPGRIDAVIELGHVDAESIAGLAQVYVGENLDGDLDADALLAIAQGAAGGKIMTPAFVVEAMQRAQLYGISQNGGSPKVTHDLIASAMRSLVPQWELMLDVPEDEAPTLDRAMHEIIAAHQ